MTTLPADEAQALLGHPDVMTIEYGRIRDGVVERAEVIEIPEAFFKAIQSSVIEQLTMARNAELQHGAIAADRLVEELVSEGRIRQEDAHAVRSKMALEIGRGIEHFAIGARDRYERHLPITLRSLIPLITRRSGKS